MFFAWVNSWAGTFGVTCVGTVDVGGLGVLTVAEVPHSNMFISLSVLSPGAVVCPVQLPCASRTNSPPGIVSTV